VFLPPEFLPDPIFAERFRREAKVIAGLEHPCITVGRGSVRGAMGGKLATWEDR